MEPEIQDGWRDRSQRWWIGRGCRAPKMDGGSDGVN